MNRNNHEIIEQLQEGVQDRHADNVLSYLQMALEAGYTIDQIEILRASGRQGERALPLTVRQATSEEITLQVRYTRGGNGLIFTRLGGNFVNVCVEDINHIDSHQFLQIKIIG